MLQLSLIFSTALTCLVTVQVSFFYSNSNILTSAPVSTRNPIGIPISETNMGVVHSLVSIWFNLIQLKILSCLKYYHLCTCTSLAALLLQTVAYTYYISIDALVICLLDGTGTHNTCTFSRMFEIYYCSSSSHDFELDHRSYHFPRWYSDYRYIRAYNNSFAYWSVCLRF